MSEKQYIQLFDDIKAPDSAVEKAVESIYSIEKTENAIKSVTKKKVHFKFVPAVAAVLVLVLFTGIFRSSLFGKKTENSFTMKVSAAEINAFDSVKIGELKGSSSSRKICFDEDNNADFIIQSKTVEFPIECFGKNIDKVNYRINGNGYFSLLKSVSDFSEIVYVDEKPSELSKAEKYPYDIATAEGSAEKAISYTIDYETQAESNAVLVLYVMDDNGMYCNSYNENVIYSESENLIIYGKQFDYEDMYYNLFNENNYTIDVTATYKDGTTETKTLNLAIQKTKMQYEDGSGNEEDKNYTTLTINATLAE